MNEVILQFWAKKTDKTPEVRYPLLFHMMDVATVSQSIWNKVIQPGTRNFISGQLGSPEEHAGRWITFWSGLHDIGKVTPDFQAKSKVVEQNLLKLGFDFKVYGTDIHHGTATASILKSLFEQKLSRELGHRIAVTVGGHHGIFPTSDKLIPHSLLGNELWRQQWEQLAASLAKYCEVIDLPSPQGIPPHSFFMMLAGLTSVADWIASNEAWFPYQIAHTDVNEHLQYAKRQAEFAIRELKWQWRPPELPGDFIQCFDFIQEIRPLQSEIIDIAPELGNHSGLLIIEAPMGEGKTEAALHMADSWLSALKERGCYFALPTQATSNQMFGRVKSFLEKRYPGQEIGLMLLHGHSALQSEFAALISHGGDRFSNVDLDGAKAYDDAPAAIVVAEWFTYRKRGLLLPFGVGTIDQALLSVLQTKHVFVRLFGMAGKTVIVDEVHAYDAYMSTLLERLLEWLAAIGSSVILLSATLPRMKRDMLLKAYCRGLGKDGKDILAKVSEIKYPRISWTFNGEFHAKTIGTSPRSVRELRILWINDNLPENDGDFELGKELQKALNNGGCAAVICNTVHHAQKVYLALKKYFPGVADDGEPELDLFHAHYLFGDRDKREKRAIVRFSKDGSEVDCGEEGVKQVRRPRCAVLVATQVIEQSLDLDFDLMVTEMAPIDLILQRAGRLQRHWRNRPATFQDKPPEIWICAPKLDAEGVPDFGSGTEVVYTPHILLRSWLILKNRPFVKIPDDIESLIEKVYGEEDWSGELNESLRNKWQDSHNKLVARRKEYMFKASQNSILPPTYLDNILEDFNKDLEEDNPSLHESLQALTRVSEGPTVQVICLYGDIDKPFLDPECKDVLDTSSPPGAVMLRRLLERSATQSHHELVPKILDEEKPVYREWRKSPLLRHHYLLFFDAEGTCTVGDYEVCLDPELGLTVQKCA